MSNIYLDYKATVWFRIPIYSKESLEEIKELLNKGFTPGELYDLDLEGKIGQCEPLYDTEEFIHPEENADFPTVEIFKDTEVIWNNVNE